MKIKKHEEIVHRAVAAGELEIDSQGRVWRLAKRGWGGPGCGIRVIPVARRRAERKVRAGYLQVAVMFDSKRYYACAHRLVFFHLKGAIPDGLTVNHKDGVKNNNRPGNLELMTHAEQTRHAREVLKVGRLDQAGEANVMAKLTLGQVKEIRQRRLQGEPLLAIAKDFSVGPAAISKIARGQRWPLAVFG